MRFRSGAAIAVALSLVVGAAHADDATERRRETFRNGMEDYGAGRYREAIGKWEGIYRELEPTDSYRLAFNLARAWDKVGDPTRAAEYFEAYLAETDRRAKEGAPLDVHLEKQAEDARARLKELQTTYGRIAIGAGPRAVKVDKAEARAAGSAGFVVYVTPGEHTVTFDPKTEAPRTVKVDAGAIVTVETPPLVSAPIERQRPLEPAAPPRYETVTERPFSPVVLYVAGGVAAATLIVPVVLYANALSVKSDYDDASRPRDERERLAVDYDSAKANAYTGAAIAGGCVAVAGGLTAWWLLGTRETKREIQPNVMVTPLGVSASLRASF